MNDKVSVKVGSNFPFLGILALIFITLKLLGKITWSWWWVLAPLWAPAALVLSFLVFGLLIAILTAMTRRP